MHKLLIFTLYLEPVGPLLTCLVFFLICQNGDNRVLSDVKPKITEADKSKIWKLTEINEQSQLRSLRLPDNLLSVKVGGYISNSFILKLELCPDLKASH